MSPHTLHSYRDSLKLLLRFAAGKKRDPRLSRVEQLTVNQILAFLAHLETRRGNKACTRNVRLAAIHSFFRYLGGSRLGVAEPAVQHRRPRQRNRRSQGFRPPFAATAQRPTPG